MEGEEDRILRGCHGPNRIEMKGEKVDGVLSWPKPKNIKDIRKFWALQIITGGSLKTLLE